MKGDKLLQAVADAVGVYYNNSGQAKCFNTSQQAVSSLGDEGWYFQVKKNQCSFQLTFDRYTALTFRAGTIC